MTFNYAKTQATALRLVTKFGRDVEMRRSGGGTFNQVSGSYSGESDTTGNIKAAILPPNTYRMAQRYPEGLIKGTNGRALAEAVNMPFDPVPGDRVKFDNEEWEVLGNNPIGPAGTYVFHDMDIVKK